MDPWAEAAFTMGANSSVLFKRQPKLPIESTQRSFDLKADASEDGADVNTASPAVWKVAACRAGVQ